MQAAHSMSTRPGPGAGEASTPLPGPVGLVIGQLTHGGSERQLYELARSLQDRGVETHVFCLSQATTPYGGALAEAGIPVHTLPRRRGVELRRVRLLAGELRRRRIWLAHSYLFIANAYARAACALAGVPAFLPSVRNLEPRRSRAARLVDGLVLRGAERVLVNAEFLGQWVASAYRVDGARVRVVPNGLDTSRFAAVPPLPVQRDGGPVVGSISLFKPQKRISFLLEVARRVLARRPGVRFRLVGDGPQRAEILALRERMGLAGAVEMPGRSEEVPAELAGLDLFVLASDREGMPNAVLEAMAAARPVVASAVPGTDEVVCHGETGLLFPPEDAEAAAQAVLSLLEDPARAAAMGQAGREAALSRFSVERMVDRTLAVYRELSRRPAGRRD